MNGWINISISTAPCRWGGISSAEPNVSAFPAQAEREGQSQGEREAAFGIQDQRRNHFWCEHIGFIERLFSYPKIVDPYPKMVWSILCNSYRNQGADLKKEYNQCGACAMDLPKGTYINRFFCFPHKLIHSCGMCWLFQVFLEEDGYCIYSGCFFPTKRGSMFHLVCSLVSQHENVFSFSKRNIPVVLILLLKKGVIHSYGPCGRVFPKNGICTA